MRWYSIVWWRLVQLPRTRVMQLSGLAVLGPLMLMVATPLAVDWLLLACAGISMVGTVGVLWEQRRLQKLPLVVAEDMVVGHLDGTTVVRFQVLLGRGRRAMSPRASVTFVRESGTPLPLPVVLPNLTAVIGPWQVVARDPWGAVGQPGSILLDVEVCEGAQRWSLQREWSAMAGRKGKFRVPVRRSGWGLVWDPDAWGIVDGLDRG